MFTNTYSDYKVKFKLHAINVQYKIAQINNLEMQNAMIDEYYTWELNR